MASERNTRNPQSVLYRRLTRLLSGPLVRYRTQLARHERRRRLDKYASKFKSTSGQQFKRVAYNPFDNLSANIMANQNRAQRYADFDQMEYFPEIAAALNLYADEMSTSTSIKPLLEIDCPNEEIKSVLDSLYHNIMNIEFNLFGWCRSMCKYGDFFLYLDIDEEHGIQNIIGLPTMEIERLEGEDKTNPNYIQYQWNSGGMTFENWQIAHLRILGDDKHAPYGTSQLESSRRIWRQLVMLEDAMMAYRIVRSPDRRVFYIDVGNIAPQDVEQYMQKVITTMKRNQVVDSDTGRVDLRYNPMSVEEDYFIPIRGAVSNTKVETLPGGTMTSDIDDVKYLKDKLLTALMIPHSYLTMMEGAEEDKTTLAQKDIRFAKTVQRLQRSVITELEKAGIIHLYILGFRGDDLLNFSLRLHNPSKLAELQELEHLRTQFDVANAAAEGYFSRRWIATNIFNLSEGEFLRNQREMFYDVKHDAALEAAAEATAIEAGAGELGGLTGMDNADALNAELGMGEDLPDMDEPEFDAPDEAIPEEGDDVLLAAPAKRDDGSYLTKGSKGKWYEPVKHTGGDRRGAGAARRSRKGKWANELSKNTDRNIFKGHGELKSLASGVYEGADPNYNQNDNEELQLFELNQEIKDLLSGLKSAEQKRTLVENKDNEEEENNE